VRLSDLEGRSYNYAPVGATRTGATPPGFHRLEVRERVGTGPEAYAMAVDALLHWRVQQTAGIRLEASAARVDVGAVSIARLGVGAVGLAAPCRVVWLDEGPARTAFAYGTLTGHPEAGEEAFVVTLSDDGTVWFTVSAYSRGATWYTRAGGPVVRALQRVSAGRYVARLRALVEASE
jgi:uncharacterized protein (UPF0548 family)